jgi:GTP-binding protein HflX
MTGEPRERERAFLIGVLLRGGRAETGEAHLDELERLAETAGAEVVGRRLLERDRPTAASFIGKGQASSLAALGAGLGATRYLFDEDLSPVQVRNLEKVLEAPVSDRSDLILEIFDRRARTREARAQVELARMQRLLPRLAGRWSHLGRQVGGGPGLRGEGEKQIELDRRMIRRRIASLRRDLRRIESGRRTRRRRRAAVHQVALVGYTNAGKSTLFNALTRAGVLVEDRLFATLDPTVRRARLADGTAVLFTDTVGFIRKLPHPLVASFRSTLEEAASADLLLHLVDLSDPAYEEQTEVGRQVLEELELDRIPRLTVHNKIDAASEGQRERARNLDPEIVPVSARSGEGMEGLLAAIAERLAPRELGARLRVRAARGDLVARVYRTLRVATEHRADGWVELAVRGPAGLVERIAREIEREGAEP